MLWVSAAVLEGGCGRGRRAGARVVCCATEPRGAIRAGSEVCVGQAPSTRRASVYRSASEKKRLSGSVVRRRPLLSGDGVARKNPKYRKARVWDFESQSYLFFRPQYCLVVVD